MNYKIEKGFELPKELSVGRKPKYPFGEMDVGDSFEFDVAIKANVASAASKYGRKVGKKFTAREISDTKGRCWRIE